MKSSCNDLHLLSLPATSKYILGLIFFLILSLVSSAENEENERNFLKPHVFL
jgi:hypothetical protein